MPQVRERKRAADEQQQDDQQDRRCRKYLRVREGVSNHYAEGQNEHAADSRDGEVSDEPIQPRRRRVVVPLSLGGGHTVAFLSDGI